MGIDSGQLTAIPGGIEMELMERPLPAPISMLPLAAPGALAAHSVSIVEADASVRTALASLIGRAGHDVRTFDSAREFLSSPLSGAPNCLILDLSLPDMSGLDLQLAIEPASRPPIIFLSGQAHIPSSVRAIRAGALDFLIKPIDERKLLDLVELGLNQDLERRARKAEQERLRRRFESLTPRERDVLPLVVEGFRNKQSAARLGISEITLQIHRTNVMRKMKARSLAALVRMAVALETSITLGVHGRTGIALDNPRHAIESNGARPAFSQSESEHRAARHAGRDPKAAAMGIDDASADRQAHAHTVGLRREEGIEDAIGGRGIESRAGILDGDLHGIRLDEL
jgi:FixJ family two-component response regulator